MKNDILVEAISDQYLHGLRYTRVARVVSYRPAITFMVEVVRCESGSWDCFVYVNGKQTSVGFMGSYAGCIKWAKEYLAEREN